MIIDWPADFDRYIDGLEEKVGAGDQHARTVLDHLYAELQVLQDLPAPPTDETTFLKQVRQSGRHQVWRVAHPFHPDVAVRLIVWFPPGEPDRIVVALLAGDKARMGDVFYNSVGARADTAIQQWQYQQRQQ